MIWGRRAALGAHRELVRMLKLELALIGLQEGVKFVDSPQDSE